MYETATMEATYPILYIDRAWLVGQRMVPSGPAAVGGNAQLTLAPELNTITVPYNARGVRVALIFEEYLTQYDTSNHAQRNRILLRLHDVLLRSQPTDLDFVRFTNLIGMKFHGSMSRIVDTFWRMFLNLPRQLPLPPPR